MSHNDYKQGYHQRMTKFDIEAMRLRLESAIKEQGRSMNDVSLSAGFSKGYLHNIIKRDQVPTVDKLEAICNELGISMLWVMYGLDVPSGAEEVFEVMRNDPDRFWAMMKLV